MTAAAKTRVRYPILGGLLPFDRARLPTEVIAGVTLAALAIPEVMGYTKIAGLPVVTGLYTILLPVFVFAVLGSSRHLVVGADSATAAILATGLASLGFAAGSPQYVAQAGLAALMCAGVLIAARVLRLGFIANFLSRSILIGFLTGVGIQVAMGQLAGILGVDAGSGSTLEKFWHTLQAIPSTSIPTFLVAVAVLATILVTRRINRAIPGPLIAVLGTIALSYLLDLQSHGVTVLGTVPGGLPAIGIPSFDMNDVARLLPTVIPLFLVILAQSAATSQAYAMRYGDSFDENVDLVGLGAANLAAGLSGTFVVNGSPTKTQMVDSAGGRSQLAQVTTGLIVLIVLLFLTGPLAYLPNAVLAAVVFLIGIELVDYRGMTLIYRLRFGEFIVALITAITVVVVGVEQGIILAIALSIVEHIGHSYRPYDTLLTVDSDGRARAQSLESEMEAAPGLAIYRFGASLYYANASRFTTEILAIADAIEPRLRWICVDAMAIADVDYSGADTIRAVHEELARKHVTLLLAGVSDEVHAQLAAYGLIEIVGADHFFDQPEDMVAAAREGKLAS